MNELTSVERRKLLKAAKKIHAHKLMQAEGYRILAKKAKEGRIKQLLLGISTDEAEHAEFWSERIKELGGQPESSTKAFLRDLKVGLMMRILGTKGFFEWTVVGEEEGIRDLAVQAENIRDVATSETWSRTASDERLHVERSKSEVLGMEEWEIRGGGGVRDLIFGANDGLVSTLALVAGVYGAITESRLILLSGVAELFAGAISMSAGAYLSSKSEIEVLEREDERKKVKKKKTLEEEREELIRFYQAEGFKKEQATAIVERITAGKEPLTHAGTLEELGLAPKELGNPVKAAVLTGVSFALAALVPVLPFAFQGMTEAVITSIVATVVTLFVVGASKTIFSRKRWIWSGLEMMVIGAFAAATTYIIGKLFSMMVGV